VFACVLLMRSRRLQVSSPMDLSTLLMRVDQRRYPTLARYMADLRSIATATQQYWAGEARGAREVSLTALLSIAMPSPPQLLAMHIRRRVMHGLPVADQETAGADGCY
jgi:hypothetical protein